MTTALVNVLTNNHACDRSLALAKAGSLAGLAPEAAWETWHYSPDLVWIAATVGVERNLITRAACDCARLVLPYLTDDARFLAVVEAVERFTENTLAQMAIIDAVALLPRTDSTADLTSARLASAKRMVNAAAATTWLDLPDLATVASDAVVQTYRAERHGFKLGADLVRARIPWVVVDAQLRKQA